MSDKDDLLFEYIRSATIQGESTLSGDYKTGNKAARKLIKIYKQMESDQQLAEYLINILFCHQHINVRLWAAAHALGLNVKKSEALVILQQISSRKDIGILRLNAEMTLKVYKEKGHLRFYKEK